MRTSWARKACQQVLLLLLSLCLLVTFGGLTNAALSAPEKAGGLFADPALEQAVREALDMPSGILTPDDVRDITELYVYDLGITDLTGLEHMVSLERLSLLDNEISDLTPLAGLSVLRDLYLDGNEISDLSPLSGLTSLEYLGLSRNRITDVSPLRSLVNLESLDHPTMKSATSVRCLS